MNDVVGGGGGLALIAVVVLRVGRCHGSGFRTELPIVGTINPHVPCDTSRVVSSRVTEPTLQRPVFVRQWPVI